MTVRVSANEFCVTVAKACVAKGVERSNAREIALACCVLEGRGVASLPVLDGALSRAGTGDAAWRVEGDTICSEAIVVLRDGCAALDLAGAFDNVRFRCDAPVLMEGLALLRGVRLVEEHGLVTLLEGGEAVRPIGPIAFRDIAWWRRMEEHATGILVPATDATRADAGAGTTDND